MLFGRFRRRSASTLGAPSREASSQEASSQKASSQDAPSSRAGPEAKPAQTPLTVHGPSLGIDPTPETIAKLRVYDVAMMIPSVITMVGDGHIHEAEMKALANALCEGPTYSMTAAETIEEIKQILVRFHTEGPDRLLDEAAAVLPREARKMAMMVAFQVAYADGKVEFGEKAALLTIKKRFGLSESDLAQANELTALLFTKPKPAA